MTIDRSPFPLNLNPRDLIGASAPGREVRMVAVTTLTGSASAGGTSGALGNDTDTALLLALRQWADVVLVGSRTAKKEQYGPVAGTTMLAVISCSLDFTGREGFLTDRTLILTPQASLDDESLAQKRQTLIDASTTLVSTGGGSAPEIIDALTSRGLLHISCEGGPGIYGLLLEADLIDIAHLTLDPRLTAPVEKALVSGNVDKRLHLESVAPTYDGTVFLRYRAARSD